jgi:hypothetical protein
MMGLTKKQTQMMAFIQARMPRPWRAPNYCEITAYQHIAVRGAYQQARALQG